jgi:predicted patatin/cPLA2 family phospholipase
MEQIIALLFLDRTLAHLEHLRTKSYSQHVALKTFYDEVIDLADKLAEAYQGYDEVMQNIPVLDYSGKNKIEDILGKHVLEIEKLRKTCCDLSAIQNIIDEIVGLYLSTIYKLRNLS